jgi:hypothetical protein
LFVNYKYDPTLTPAQRKQIEEPKLRQFEQVYRKLAATLVFDVDSKGYFYDVYDKLPEPKNKRDEMIKFTQQTNKGDCEFFTYRMSSELDKLGINNWMIRLEGEKFDHAANVFEQDGKLFVSDLVMSVGYLGTKGRQPPPNYTRSSFITCFS